METWGRAGTDLLELLAHLGVLAAEVQEARGVPRTRWKHRWCVELSWLAATSTADAVLQAGSCIDVPGGSVSSAAGAALGAVEE